MEKTVINPDALIHKIATDIKATARVGNIPKIDIDFKKGITLGEATTANKSSEILTRNSKKGQFSRYLTYFKDLQDQGYEALRFDLITPFDMKVSDVESYFEDNKVFFRHFLPYYKKGKGENEVLIDFRYRVGHSGTDQTINDTVVTTTSETAIK